MAALGLGDKRGYRGGRVNCWREMRDAVDREAFEKDRFRRKNQVGKCECTKCENRADMHRRWQTRRD